MKPLNIFILLFLFCITACGNKQPAENQDTNTSDTTTTAITTAVKDSFETGKLINNVICKTDASQSYALYIPSLLKVLSVIYFFDPHADGSLPLKNYKSLADKYGFILIGSNN